MLCCCLVMVAGRSMGANKLVLTSLNLSSKNKGNMAAPQWNKTVPLMEESACLE